MSRLARVLVLSAIAFGVVVPSAAADSERRLGGALGALWEVVLEAPLAENPLTGGDPCVDLGGRRNRRIVAPFAPSGTATLTCTVRPGTRLLITAQSSECSTAEPPPYFGRDEAELRECARTADAGYTVLEISLNGESVPVTEVETALLKVVLPEDNILGQPAGTRAQSVGHGWVALLDPLPVGTHIVVIHVEGVDVFGNAVDLTNTTTIIVQPRR